MPESTSSELQRLAKATSSSIGIRRRICLASTNAIATLAAMMGKARSWTPKGGLAAGHSATGSVALQHHSTNSGVLGVGPLLTARAELLLAFVFIRLSPTPSPPWIRFGRG